MIKYQYLEEHVFEDNSCNNANDFIELISIENLFEKEITENKANYIMSLIPSPSNPIEYIQSTFVHFDKKQHLPIKTLSSLWDDFSIIFLKAIIPVAIWTIHKNIKKYNSIFSLIGKFSLCDIEDILYNGKFSELPEHLKEPLFSYIDILHNIANSQSFDGMIYIQTHVEMCSASIISFAHMDFLKSIKV